MNFIINLKRLLYHGQLIVDVDKNFLFVSWSIFSRLLYVKKIWTTRYRRWMIETDRRCITHIIFL